MKKHLSLILAILILLMCLPIGVSADIVGSGIQEKFNTILSVYPSGSYFTVKSSTSPCSAPEHNKIGIWCPGCALQNIPARGGLPSGAAVGKKADSCCGFANYVYYYVFGHNRDTQTTQTSSPVFGDLVDTGAHWFVYLSEDSKNYYVFDANGYNGSSNKVIYNNYYPKSKVSKLTVYHATNYDTINNSKTITYSNITTGNYYLKNKSTGTYLDIESGKDADKTVVHVWDFNGSNAQKMYIFPATNGYKIRPACSSTRLINAYAWEPKDGTVVNLYGDDGENTQWWYFQSVSGGYVIKNVHNQNLCMTVEKSGDVMLRTYSGSDTQIWTLEPGKSYTITYDANGGSGAPSAQTAYHGHSITLSSVVPTRKEYTFLGWSTSNQATKATYQKGASISPTADLKLYAVWQKNTTSTTPTNPPVHTHTTVTKNAKPATCTSSGYTGDVVCTSCNETIKKGETIKALGHDYHTSTINATCTEKGQEKQVCSRCNAVITNVTPALGHNYKAVVTAPTCTSGGYTTYTCTRCHGSYIANSTPAMGHVFSEWNVTKNATETATGSKERTCSRCKTVEKAAIPALGHTHSFGSTWEHDEADHWHGCVCGERNAVSKHIDNNADGKCDTCASVIYVAHRFLSVPSAAVKKNVSVAFATDIPAAKITEVEIDGNKIAKSEINTKGTQASVEISGGVTGTLSVGEHTVTIYYTGGSVSTQFSIADATPEKCSHTHTIIVGDMKESCTENGYTGDIYCADCYERIQQGQAVSAKGHTYQNGVCIRCGEVESVPADTEEPSADTSEPRYTEEAPDNPTEKTTKGASDPAGTNTDNTVVILLLTVVGALLILVAVLLVVMLKKKR